jgi:hypothetical protein
MESPMICAGFTHWFPRYENCTHWDGKIWAGTRLTMIPAPDKALSLEHVEARGITKTQLPARRLRGGRHGFLVQETI